MAHRPAGLGRPFHRLLIAGGAANLGDGMVRVLLPLMALAIGATASGVAAVAAASTVAWPVFGLHAGWLVDRADRRRLLVAANVVRAVTLSALGAAILAEGLQLWMILAAAIVLGVAETIVDTAVTSLVPTVVEPSGYGRANSRIEATVNVTNELLGPSLAGLLAGLTLAAAAGSSAALYAVAVAVLIGLHAAGRRHGGAADGAAARPIPRPTADTTDRDQRARRLTSGLRFIWATPLLRALVLFTAAMNVVWGGSIALLVVYAVEPGPLGLSPAAYGLLLTTMAVGGIAASVLTEPLRRRFGDARLLIADAVGTVLLVLPVALGAGVVAVAVGAVVAGAGSSVWRIINATIRQVITPDDLLGRVYAATRVISWGVVPVAAVVAGGSAEAWGLRTTFTGLTVLAVVVAIAFVPFAARAERAAASGGEPEPSEGEPVSEAR
ncbi:MFS transporter [Intrasporangium sp.]|uniref:MFS transporter n=1 Tax=Intrasporangium sp. TaxID=1925024 RepID=UPI00293AA353|nr:MFS transporter [Intrasporangium sp.]MDV3222607.1 MFS transporter [Intrasporangium sp.]